MGCVPETACALTLIVIEWFAGETFRRTVKVNCRSRPIRFSGNLSRVYNFSYSRTRSSSTRFSTLPSRGDME